jgi:uncharacterized protein (DUF58 family)
VGVFAAWLTNDWLLATVVMLAMAGADRALLAAIPFPARSDIAVRIAVQSGDGRRALVAGGVGVIRVRIENLDRERAFSFRVHPVLPPGLTDLGDPEAHAVLPARDVLRLGFPVRILRVGTAVIPGVIVERSGLLGLFRRRVFVGARCEVALLPDYGQSDHPVVARFLRPGMEVGEHRRQRAVKGAGTEFAEIRDYRLPDSIRRVDWKASARRTRLMVREYEEPREHTIRVILDGSRDLTEGEDDGAGFRRAAALIGKLAYVAMSQSMALELTVFDRNVVLTRRLEGGSMGHRRLLADVVAIPRHAMLRAAKQMLDPDEIERLAGERFRRTLGRWRGIDRRESLDSFLSRWRPNGKTPDPAEFLVDFHPDAILGLEDRCEACDRSIFEDEPACSGCGTARGVNGFTPRGVCLSSVLMTNLRRSRGREMWVVIGSFHGGEACDGIADLLEVSATRHRRVHVVLPKSRRVSELRSTLPVSMGVYPDLGDAVADAEALYASVAVDDFARRLAAAGIATHALRDPAALEEIVAQLLLSEVLGR